jgi:protein-S-isoprenylcysteine O-methyltransferase Ste14
VRKPLVGRSSPHPKKRGPTRNQSPGSQYNPFMLVYAFVVLALGWLAWVTPFFLVNKEKQPAKQVDKRARWGILLVAVGYAFVWQARFWELSLPLWRFALSILFFVLAALLSWTGARALGKQWRMDAGLTADHQLVQSGPYRVVRHPIYASMFCTLCATGFLFAPWWLFVPAVLFFIAGTEVRVHIEEKLLGAQFGEQFAQFKRRVPAYIPFLR